MKDLKLGGWHYFALDPEEATAALKAYCKARDINFDAQPTIKPSPNVPPGVIRCIETWNGSYPFTNPRVRLINYADAE